MRDRAQKKREGRTRKPLNNLSRQLHPELYDTRRIDTLSVADTRQSEALALLNLRPLSVEDFSSEVKGSSDDDDEDSSSDEEVEITINAHQPTAAEFVDDQEKFKIEGVIGLPGIYGPLRVKLINFRFAQEKDRSPNVVPKNLVVLFQGHILFEDCLTSEALQQIGGARYAKSKVLSHLQGGLGVGRSHNEDSGFVHKVMHLYKKARISAIGSALKKGKTPKDPQDPLGALLIKLIDRAIIFDFRKKPLAVFGVPFMSDEVLQQRAQLVKETLDDQGKWDGLFAEFGAFIPSNLRRTPVERPWEIESWVKQNFRDVYKKVAADDRVGEKKGQTKRQADGEPSNGEGGHQKKKYYNKNENKKKKKKKQGQGHEN